MIRGLFKSVSTPFTKHALFVTRTGGFTGLGHSTKFIHAPIRSFTQFSIFQTERTQPEHSSTSSAASQPLKELRDMPGPWKIPLLGVSPELLMADPKKSIQNFAKLPQKYGKIFKVKLLPGMPELVCVFDPEDAKTVFRSESKYPRRLPLDIWEETRTAYGKPIGLFFL